MSSNLNDPRHPWARLVAAARTVRDERDTSAPYGFATRVAALAMAQQPRMVSLFDRFALRALGIACLLALGSLALNYQALTTPVASNTAVAVASSEEIVIPTDDAVAVVLDLVAD